MLEMMLKMAREDKSMLDRYEADDKMQRMVIEAEDEGRELTLGDLQRMGASVQSFDSTRKLDEIDGRRGLAQLGTFGSGDSK